MDRKAISETVIASPENYMICVACRSILRRRDIHSCPVCKAYGFDYRPEAVIHVATELGSREDTTIPWS